MMQGGNRVCERKCRIILFLMTFIVLWGVSGCEMEKETVADPVLIEKK